MIQIPVFLRNFAGTMLLLLIAGTLPAQNNQSEKPSRPISMEPFSDSRNHWYGIRDAGNIVNPRANQPTYPETEITKIADNILLFQRDNGGWPKNYDMQAILTNEQKDSLLQTKGMDHTTFDNSTTYTHVDYLASVFTRTSIEKYREGCLRGIRFILKAQFPNGGWPQYYPLEPNNYSSHITFNDGAFLGVMETLNKIRNHDPVYEFLGEEMRQQADLAWKRGLDCILKCQIRSNNRLTAWCQQHNEADLQPAWARAYEMPSICNGESAQIVLMLMSLDNPDPRIIESVRAAIKWFEDSKILHTRVKTIAGPPEKSPYKIVTTDKVVVADPAAPPIWTRFYEIGTERPLFSDRNSKLLYSMAEVSRERRAGYGWYTYAPQSALDKFPAWEQKWCTKPIPQDTSYTPYQTWLKIRKEFPDARIIFPDNNPAVTARYNIIYRQLSNTPYGSRSLHMDIFRPAKKGIYPAVLMIHGGGWRSGNRTMQIPLARKLASEGYVTAVAEYRLSMEAIYPAAVYDLKEAIRYLRTNAAQLNLDPDRIALSGCSAGGQLAALLGMTGDNPVFNETGAGPVSTKIQAIIDVDGVLDFRDPNESGKDDDPAKPSAGTWWFGATFKQAPDKWIEASPIEYAGKGTPPILFINSALPRFHAGRDSVISMLNQHKIYSEVHTIPNTPHPFWLFSPWFDSTVDYMKTFLDNHLKK